jgi:hypothetical protein
MPSPKYLQISPLIFKQTSTFCFLGNGDVRMAVCQNQILFLLCSKSSTIWCTYVSEAYAIFERNCVAIWISFFFADASGGIFLRWCTGLLKNISRLEKDSELHKNTCLLLQNHVKVSLMPLWKREKCIWRL